MENLQKVVLRITWSSGQNELPPPEAKTDTTYPCGLSGSLFFASRRSRCVAPTLISRPALRCQHSHRLRRTMCCRLTEKAIYHLGARRKGVIGVLSFCYKMLFWKAGSGDDVYVISFVRQEKRRKEKHYKH